MGFIAVIDIREQTEDGCTSPVGTMLHCSVQWDRGTSEWGASHEDHAVFSESRPAAVLALFAKLLGVGPQVRAALVEPQPPNLLDEMLIKLEESNKDLPEVDVQFSPEFIQMLCKEYDP